MNKISGRILITAPTEVELKPLADLISTKNAPDLYLHVSGIGTPRLMFSLMHLLENERFDFMIQVGVAGTFSPRKYPNGTVVMVKEDQFADILIDDNGRPKRLSDFGFMDYNEFPFSNGILKVEDHSVFAKKLPQVRSITVNSTTGSKDVLQQRVAMFNPDIESMEGAAFFYVALMKGIPCIQLRAVSNFVGERNTKSWDIPLALQNLHAFLKQELLP